MKTIKTLIFVVAAALLASCATTVRFPVSNVTPAAVITAKKKQDKHDNYIIELTANNLAAADRLNPPRSHYIVWIISDNKSVINVGRLTNRNARNTNLKVTTPHNATAIFITAEDQSDLSFPTGVEITRASFDK